MIVDTTNVAKIQQVLLLTHSYNGDVSSSSIFSSYFFITTTLTSKMCQRRSANLLSMFVACLQLYNVSLIFGDPQVFTKQKKNKISHDCYKKTQIMIQHGQTTQCI